MFKIQQALPYAICVPPPHSHCQHQKTPEYLRDAKRTIGERQAKSIRLEKLGHRDVAVKTCLTKDSPLAS